MDLVAWNNKHALSPIFHGLRFPAWLDWLPYLGVHKAALKVLVGLPLYLES